METGETPAWLRVPREAGSPAEGEEGAGVGEQG